MWSVLLGMCPSLSLCCVLLAALDSCTTHLVAWVSAACVPRVSTSRLLLSCHASTVRWVSMRIAVARLAAYHALVARTLAGQVLCHVLTVSLASTHHLGLYRVLCALAVERTTTAMHRHLALGVVLVSTRQLGQRPAACARLAMLTWTLMRRHHAWHVRVDTMLRRA